MKFNTKWDRVKSTPNTVRGEKMVITAGYIPLNVRIRNFEIAGENLKAYREMMYPNGTDYFNEDPDSYPRTDQDEIEIMQNAEVIAERSRRQERENRRNYYENQKKRQDMLRKQNPSRDLSGAVNTGELEASGAPKKGGKRSGPTDIQNGGE